ncbi:hypothetical protein ACFWPU_00675 [Streptomyces sp. NPDC058471]|uniref:hypothetical protein n=1 Tax=Streptomyces sp. NPDC058471 TaxID=3346516 RepID=UPI00364C33A2
MPYAKITYNSPNNVGVQGSDYIELEPEDLDENGELPDKVQSAIWQDAVNEYMSDTYIEVVEHEGD